MCVKQDQRNYYLKEAFLVGYIRDFSYVCLIKFLTALLMSPPFTRLYQYMLKFLVQVKRLRNSIFVIYNFEAELYTQQKF